MTVQHECELILALPDAEKLQQVAHARAWGGTPLRFQSNTRLTDWYWDTPEHALLRAGWAIRLRVSGKEAALEAKSMHPTDPSGVNLREEFHQRARINFNGILSTLEVGSVSMLISNLLDKPVLDIELAPLFAATRIRKTYKIMAHPLAYLMLDSGAIHHPGTVPPELGAAVKEFFRFEVEGDPAAQEALREWALALATELGAEITSVSKFELAWQALGMPEELLALAHAAASRHPLAVDQVRAAPAEAAGAQTAEPAKKAKPAAGSARKGSNRAAAVVAGPAKTAAGAGESSAEAARRPATGESRGPSSGATLVGSAAAAIAAAMAEVGVGQRTTEPTPAVGSAAEERGASRAVNQAGSDEVNAAASDRSPIQAAVAPRPVSGRRPRVLAGLGREDDLPPVIAHADVGGSLVKTAEPIDAVLDDACHDPITNELKPLEEWPVEFRDTCIRREAGGSEFISEVGFLLRRPPMPDSRADNLMRVAASLFDATAPLHRLDPRFRALLLSLAHLSGTDFSARAKVGSSAKGAARWLSLRDRIVYHGLPEYSGRACWVMGLAAGTLSRENRDTRQPAWRRLAYEDRQDALRLGALLKLARDFERKAGPDWLPAGLDVRHGQTVLLVDYVGFRRERLKLKSTGGFWRSVFGEGLPLRRREPGAVHVKHPAKFKARPFDRKQVIDIFTGQNTGAAIAEILAHQRGVVEEQDRRLRELRQRPVAVTVEEFPADPLIEVIHDYRVALRRLRSYVRLFELPLGRGPVRTMAEPMQALAEPTSALRQLDVLIETVMADAQAGAFRHGHEPAGRQELPLLAYLLQRRVAVVQAFWAQWERSQTTVLRDRMVGVLRPDRWCWVGRFGSAKLRRGGDETDFNPGTQGDRGRSRRAQQTPIDVFAAGALLQSLGEARVLYEAARPDPLHCPFGDLHAVRIALKKLRYGFELFAPLMGDATHAAIEVSKRLQDQLGAINDCEANGHCLLMLLETAPPQRARESLAGREGREGREAKSAVEPVRAAADQWLNYSHKRIHETRLHLVETWPRLFGRSVVKQLVADWWL